jgi:hypothetical protein
MRRLWKAERGNREVEAREVETTILHMPINANSKSERSKLILRGRLNLLTIDCIDSDPLGLS